MSPKDMNMRFSLKKHYQKDLHLDLYFKKNLCKDDYAIVKFFHSLLIMYLLISKFKITIRYAYKFMYNKFHMLDVMQKHSKFKH